MAKLVDNSRENWKINSNVEIKDSKNIWYQGRIQSINDEKDGEWLTVVYKDENKQIMMKKIQRFSQDIKPINNDQEMKEPKQQKQKNPRLYYDPSIHNQFNDNIAKMYPNLDFNELHFLYYQRGCIKVAYDMIIKYLPTNVLNIVQERRKHDKNGSNNNNNNESETKEDNEPIIAFVIELFNEYDIVTKAHYDLINDKGWNVQVNKYDNISVWYKKNENSQSKKNDIHSIKIRFLCKCSVLDILAILNEIDLMNEIMTIIKTEGQFLKQFNDRHKIMFNKMYMWWPLKNRYAVCTVKAYDLLTDFNEIFIWGKTLKNRNAHNIELPKLDKKDVEFEVVMGNGVIKPIKWKNKILSQVTPKTRELYSKELNDSKIENLIEITSEFNVDFDTVLPTSLVNWITRTFAYYGCKLIRQRCENLKGTNHQKRIDSKQIYKDWSVLIDEWETNHT